MLCCMINATQHFGHNLFKVRYFLDSMGIKEAIAKNPKKLFWISIFTNLSALSAVITMFYLHRGLNLYEISILGAIVSWAIILLEIPTGMFSDIVGRKKTVVFGVIALIVYNIIFIFAHNFLMFAIASIFFALSTSLFSGCITSIIYDSLREIGEEHKAKEQIAGAIVVPPIASLIAKDLLESQFFILLLISLIGYIIALTISFSLHELKDIKESKIKRSTLLKESFNNIIKSRPLLKMTINQGIGFVCLMVFFSILWQPYFKEQGVPISIFGTVLAISNILLFLVLRNMSKIEKIIKIKPFIFLSSFIPGIILIVMARYSNFYVSIIGFIIVHILITSRDPPFVHYKNRYIDPSRRVTTISIISMIYALMAVIIQPILGAIADRSIHIALITLGIILIINPIFFRVNNKDIGSGD